MYSIKPGRGPSLLGGISGIFGVIFGVFWTVMAYGMTRDSSFPLVGVIFPLFGVFFVIVGVIGVIYNFMNAGSKNRFSVLDVTRAQEEPDPLNQIIWERVSSAEDTKARLQQLEDLKKSGLISAAEYADLRGKVLSKL